MPIRVAHDVGLLRQLWNCRARELENIARLAAVAVKEGPPVLRGTAPCSSLFWVQGRSYKLEA